MCALRAARRPPVVLTRPTRALVARKNASFAYRRDGIGSRVAHSCGRLPVARWRRRWDRLAGLAWVWLPEVSCTRWGLALLGRVRELRNGYCAAQDGQACLPQRLKTPGPYLCAGNSAHRYRRPAGSWPWRCVIPWGVSLSPRLSPHAHNKTPRENLCIASSLVQKLPRYFWFRSRSRSRSWSWSCFAFPVCPASKVAH